MDIVIDKQDFEWSLPVGMSAHDEVYESVKPAIDTALDNYCISLLGDVGIQQVMAAEESTALKRYFKMMVCIDGFLSVLRQLDLVLTPTGFGIVSNDTVSPASKQRVDALEAQLRTALCRARAMTVHLLRSEEWGCTAKAVRAIRYAYTDHYFFFASASSGAYSYKDWQNMQPVIQRTDELLRVRFGDEQTDDLLDAYRRDDHDRLTAYTTALQLTCDLTDRAAASSEDVRGTALWRRLERELEGNGEVYALYHGSDAYKAAHVETFGNKKESTAFLFNG